MLSYGSNLQRFSYYFVSRRSTFGELGQGTQYLFLYNTVVGGLIRLNMLTKHLGCALCIVSLCRHFVVESFYKQLVAGWECVSCIARVSRLVKHQFKRLTCVVVVDIEKILFKTKEMSKVSLADCITLTNGVLVISSTNSTPVKTLTFLPVQGKSGGKLSNIRRLHTKYCGAKSGGSCTRISDLPLHITSYIMKLAETTDTDTIQDVNESVDATWNFAQHIALKYITSYIQPDKAQQITERDRIIEEIGSRYSVKRNGQAINDLQSTIIEKLDDMDLDALIANMANVFLLSFYRQGTSEQHFSRTLADILSTMRLSHLQGKFCELFKLYINKHVENSETVNHKESDIEYIVALILEDLGGRGDGSFTDSNYKINKFLERMNVTFFVHVLDYINDEKYITFQKKSDILINLYHKFQQRFGEVDYSDGGDW